MKDEFQPVLFRVASKAFDAVQRSRTTAAPPKLPTYYWERAVFYRQRMLLAQERGWHFSVEETRTDLIGTITLLQRYVGECATKISARSDGKWLYNSRRWEQLSCNSSTSTRSRRPT